MFKINDFVKVKNTNIYGYIYRIINSKGYKKYMIISGTNKIVLAEEELEISDIKNKKKQKTDVTLNLVKKEKESLDEIMLRHMQKEEAILMLDKFIDDAICLRKQKVKIIHGRHGGVLRNAVQEYLAKHPNVERFCLGDYYEGSIGVTIAYLKY